MQIGKQSSNANESVDERIGRAIEEVKLNIIKEEIKRMDPLLHVNSKVFRTAVVLMAAASHGTVDVGELAAFTKYSRPFIAKISDGMRASGLWTDVAVCADFFFEGDAISPRLWLGCLAASGMVELHFS